MVLSPHYKAIDTVTTTASTKTATAAATSDQQDPAHINMLQLSVRERIMTESRADPITHGRPYLITSVEQTDNMHGQLSSLPSLGVEPIEHNADGVAAAAAIPPFESSLDLDLSAEKFAKEDTKLTTRRDPSCCLLSRKREKINGTPPPKKQRKKRKAVEVMMSKPERKDYPSQNAFTKAKRLYELIKKGKPKLSDFPHKTSYAKALKDYNRTRNTLAVRMHRKEAREQRDKEEQQYLQTVSDSAFLRTLLPKLSKNIELLQHAIALQQTCTATEAAEAEKLVPMDGLSHMKEPFLHPLSSKMTGIIHSPTASTLSKDEEVRLATLENIYAQQ